MLFFVDDIAGCYLKGYRLEDDHVMIEQYSMKGGNDCITYFLSTEVFKKTYKTSVDNLPLKPYNYPIN